MKRTNKKGFTIVELVIVIAVIAILAAVLIPNISRLVRKAQVSNDLSLVRNLNLALETESATMDYPTAYDAFAAVKENGYDIAKIEAKASNNKILYDEVNKCFVYLNGVNLEYYPNSKKGDKATPNHQLWTVVTSVKDAENSKYSVYWNGGDGATVEVTNVGFDVGENKNVNVTVTAATQELTVRTNGGNMMINSNGTVNHYGMIETADLQKVASESYHEFGYVTSYIKVTSGRIVVEPKASVSIIAVAGNGVSVEQKAGAELFKVAPTGDVTSIDTSKIKVLANDIITTDKLGDLNKLRYGGGTGVDGDPYQLYTAAHLVAFAKDVNEGKFNSFIYAKLCADVDISGMGWEPIGNVEHAFLGSFDGGKHTINGLTNKGYSASTKLFGTTSTAKNSGTAYGFFGVIGDMNGDTADKDMTFKDVNFTNVNIDTDEANMLGVLIGADTKAAKGTTGTINESLKRNLKVENITTAGTINCDNKSGSTVSGVVGKIYTSGTVEIQKCENKINITVSGDTNKVAGILGFVNDFTTITVNNCVNSGAISIKSCKGYVAGILSYGSGAENSPAKTMTITNNVNKGDIKSEMVDGSTLGINNGSEVKADFYYNTSYIMCCASWKLSVGSTVDFTGNKNQGSITVGDNAPAGIQFYLIRVTQSEKSAIEWNGKKGTLTDISNGTVSNK